MEMTIDNVAGTSGSGAQAAVLPAFAAAPRPRTLRAAACTDDDLDLTPDLTS